MEEYRTIIHLELNGKHEYYGSPSSMYDKHTADELGISKAALNNYFYKHSESTSQVYENNKCIIRKGKMYAKATTRGRRKKKPE